MLAIGLAIALGGCDSLLGIHDFGEFDLSTCPPGYAPLASMPARLRFAPVNLAWRDAEATCEADGPTNAPSHLVVFADATEEQMVWSALAQPMGSPWVWSGAWQEGPGFATLFGTPYNPSFQPPQPMTPTGSGASPNDGLVVGMFSAGDAISDIVWPVNFDASIICECDGRAITQRAPDP
jgi:hypothetical protein